MNTTMENTEMGPNEGILQALDEIVAVDLEQQIEIRKPRKRSSILKRNDDNITMTEDLQSKRKSINSKRVSFADRFQVMEMNTGNIYDISGKSNSTLQKDSIQNEDFDEFDQFPDENVFESTSRKSVCISTSLNVKVTVDESFSQSSLAMKHKIDSDSDSEPVNKRLHHQKSFSYPGVENNFTDSSEIRNQVFRHGSDNQFDKENQCIGSALHKNPESDNSLFQSSMLSRPKRNSKKMVSNNLNVLQTENTSQETSIPYKVNEPRHEKKSKKIAPKETALPVTGIEQNVCLTTRSQDAELHPLLLTDDLLIESKENIYIDQRNKSILITNPRQLNLRGEKSELLDKSSYSHIQSLGVITCIPEPSRSKKSVHVGEKSHLNKSFMDLTCVSEMNNTNDSESFSFQNDITSEDPLLHDQSSILQENVHEKEIKRDQGNKTILNSTCQMDLTCNLQTLSNVTSDIKESSKKASMVAFSHNLTSKVDNMQKSFSSQKQVLNEKDPSFNMDFTCYQLDSKVNISSEKMSQLNKNLKSANLYSNNETEIGNSNFMELTTCNLQTLRNMTCSHTSSEEKILPQKIVHQQSKEQFCMESFANKTTYETSCIMDTTCKLQDITDVESDSPEINAKDIVDFESLKLIVNHQKQDEEMIQKQDIEILNSSSYQKNIHLQEKLTADKTSNYMELTCNPEYLVNMTCSPNTIEKNIPSVLVPQQPNTEFYMKSFADKTSLKTSCNLDLTCKPQEITNMELDSSEVSVKDAVDLDSSKLIIESERLGIQSKEINEENCLSEKVTKDKTCLLDCSMQVTCVQPEINFSHEFDNSIISSGKGNSLKLVHSQDDTLSNQAISPLMNSLNYRHLNKTKFDTSHCMELTCNVQNMPSTLPETESNILNTLDSSYALVSDQIDKDFFEPIILDEEKCTLRDVKKYDIDEAYEKNLLEEDFTKSRYSSNFQSSNLLKNATKNDLMAVNQQKNPNTQGEFLFSSNNAREQLFNKINVGLSIENSKDVSCEAIQDNMKIFDAFSKTVDKDTDEIVIPPLTSSRNQIDEETNSILDVFDNNLLESKQDKFLFTESITESTYNQRSETEAGEKIDSPMKNSSVSSIIVDRISTSNEAQNDPCPLFVPKNSLLDVKKSEAQRFTLSPNIIFGIKHLTDLKKVESNNENVCNLPEVFFSVQKQAKPRVSSSNPSQTEIGRNHMRQLSNLCNEELSFIPESNTNSPLKCGLSVVPDSSSTVSPENCSPPTIPKITRPTCGTVTKKLFTTNYPSTDDDSQLLSDSTPMMQWDSSKPVELPQRKFPSEEKNPEVKNMLAETDEKEKVTSCQEIGKVLEDCPQVLENIALTTSKKGKEEQKRKEEKQRHEAQQARLDEEKKILEEKEIEKQRKEKEEQKRIEEEMQRLYAEKVRLEEEKKILKQEKEKERQIQQKLEEEEQKRKEDEKQRLEAEIAKLKEEKKMFEEKEKLKQLQQKKDEEERKRKEEEEKLRLEAEKAKLEKEKQQQKQKEEEEMLRFEAEKAKLEKEKQEQKRKEEEEKLRLEAEKAKLEKEKQEQKRKEVEEKLRLEAEKAKLEKEKQEQKQKEEEEKLRLEAEKAKLEKEKQVQKRKEEEEKLRLEAEKVKLEKEKQEQKRKEEEKIRLEAEKAKLEKEKQEQKRKEEEKLRLEAEKAKLEEEKQKQNIQEQQKEERKRKQKEDNEKLLLEAKKAKLEKEGEKCHQKNTEDDYEMIHTLRKKIIEASEDEDCRWRLRYMDEEHAIFEILYDSVFATYVMDISLKQEAGVLTCVEVSFNHRKEDDLVDENDEIGFLLFKTRVNSVLSLSSFSFEQLPDMLSTIQDIAEQARSLICDIWPVHLQNKTSIDFSQDIPRFFVDILDFDNLDSQFLLTFPIDVKTYPSEKIIPVVKHIDYEEIDPKVILEPITKIEPGEDYLSRMVNAVKPLLYFSL